MHYARTQSWCIQQLNGLKKVLKREFNIDLQALQFETNYYFADKLVTVEHEILISYFIDHI